ncbi:MAG: type II secretion system protein [Candidatus Shapirobacteria bacterium]|jgi:prepilin-type N-terminal cleavage/methylation domain-containing protein
MNVRSRGFTLVELVVAITIMGLVITVGVVSLNKFGSTQKIEEAREGLITSLRMARNYAMTGQSMSGVADLKYVTFSVDSEGNVSVFPNDAGAAQYFSKDISPEGVMIGVGTSLRFASYEGKLVDSSGSPVNSGVGFTVFAGDVSRMEDPGGGGLMVRVSASGLINE